MLAYKEASFIHCISKLNPKAVSAAATIRSDKAKIIPSILLKVTDKKQKFTAHVNNSMSR